MALDRKKNPFLRCVDSDGAYLWNQDMVSQDFTSIMTGRMVASTQGGPGPRGPAKQRLLPEPSSL